MKLLIFIALLIAAVLTLRYFMPSVGKSVVGGVTVKQGESLLADCPSTPNCQCSEASRASQQADRFPVTSDPSQSIATLARVVEQIPGMTVVQLDQRYLYATATSPLMQYVDDVEFLLSDDNQSIQVRSASRLGKSDLGANGKRVDAIREAFEGVL